ncbi:MAG: sugar ABC transporter ATP-binding protein [Alkalispirochaeta sp.]
MNFDVQVGEVHALLGENGAGKSTLIKILSGAYTCDAGMITIGGEEIDLPAYNPRVAQKLGVVTVYQNFHLIPHLTVAENISLSDMAMRYGLLDWSAIYRRAQEVLAGVDFDIDPRRKVRELTVSQKQMLEIAIGMSKNARVLILDEPTAALSSKETQTLFEFIRSIKQGGLGIIYISHKLEEITEIADRVTVLRDGKGVKTFPAKEAHVDAVVTLMTGRDVEQLQREPSHTGTEVLFTAENFQSGTRVKGAGFELRSGEILGLTGLVGSGKTELARAVFGADSGATGQVRVYSQTLKQHDIVRSVREGVGYVPEDRDAQGLCMNMGVRENLSLAYLVKFIRFVFSPNRETNMVKRFVEALRIRTADIDQYVKYLSGGNKQKVVLAKWLAADCRVLILDEPTIGIDVGAREEIYRHQVILAYGTERG